MVTITKKKKAAVSILISGKADFQEKQTSEQEILSLLKSNITYWWKHEEWMYANQKILGVQAITGWKAEHAKKLNHITNIWNNLSEASAMGVTDLNYFGS